MSRRHAIVSVDIAFGGTMDEAVWGVVGAAVGAFFAAAGTWLSSRHRTRGAIREKGIEIAEYDAAQLRLKPSTSMSASDYVQLVGALITFFMHTIEPAEGRRKYAPELPSNMAEKLSAYVVKGNTEPH
jgi:hypothetical protein